MEPSPVPCVFISTRQGLVLTWVPTVLAGEVQEEGQGGCLHSTAALTGKTATQNQVKTAAAAFEPEGFMLSCYEQSLQLTSLSSSR